MDTFQILCRHMAGLWSREGQPGYSHVERKYGFVLNEIFLFVQNNSIYEPEEKNPKGEIHEDWGLISYDRARETFIFRQFHIEGFVNQYLLESITEDGQTFSLLTPAIKNIAPGCKAKETYRILGPDKFVESFELAAQEKDFEICSAGHFQRVHAE